MTAKELEQRVIALEREVERLSNELTVKETVRQKNWLAAVEKYAGDEDILAVMKEAMRLREEDRSRARSRQTQRRRPRS